ncbi:MAG TPA: IS30 family transposase [Streptosporangiaceae bacterium]
MAGVRLRFGEREEIAWRRDRGEGIREIARALGRAPSTVSRELARNVSPSPRRYRAFPAHIMARERARRAKPRKLVRGSPLRAEVARLLRMDYSPGQIAGRLKLEYPGDRGMQVSHETIYQALFVQGKGSLRAEVAAALRCGRARRRRPRRGNHTGRTRIAGLVSISERPAEAADRAVPGHWEGDLIIGKGQHSAVATLAERASRFCLIIALPDGRTADKVADALADRILTLPEALRRTLTWDRGFEMTSHARFSVATGVPVYFADPHSPWQRGTNENTNGLIRYYLPEGTDLSVHSQADLDVIADKLNTRPRRTLDYRTPAEALDALLAA